MKNRIDFWRNQRGLTYERLANLVGSSAQQMQRLARGERRLTTMWMDKIAPALGVRPADLMAIPADTAPMGPLYLLAARFRAARIGVAGEIETAAAELKLNVEDLRAYESGERPIPDEVIIKFCGRTGVPLHWFSSGSLEGMRAEIAARIGYFAPELIPGLQDFPSKTQQVQEDGIS